MLEKNIIDDVEINKDGIPVDKELRRMTMNIVMRFKDKSLCDESELRKIALKTIQKKKDNTIPEGFEDKFKKLLSILQKSSVLSCEHPDRNNPYYKISKNFVNYDADKMTYEEKSAAFDTSLKSLVSRMVTKPEAQEKAFYIIKKLKRTRTYHEGKAGRYNAIVCPVTIELGKDGEPKITEAVFCAYLPNGVKFFRVSDANAIKLEINDKSSFVKINFNKAVSEPLLDESFNGSMIPVFKNENTTLTNELYCIGVYVRRYLKVSLDGITKQRELLGDIIGEEITPQQWRSSSLSIKRGYKPNNKFRWLLSQGMDKEIRRLAYRKNNFMGRDYNWFLDTTLENRKRRKQASDAFPALQHILTLKSMTKVIDDGKPLIPALSQLMKLNENKIKKFVGVNRQALKKKNVDLINNLIVDRNNDDFNKFINGLPIDKFILSEGCLKTHTELFRYMTGYGLPTFKNIPYQKIIQEPEYMNELFSKRYYNDAIHGTADLFDKLLMGWFFYRNDEENYQRILETDYFYGKKSLLRDDQYNNTRLLRRIFFEEIVGPGLSRKRMNKFTDLWHRHMLAIVTEERALQRRDTSLLTWGRLEKDFDHSQGKLFFLTSDEELYLEGLQMSHCVSGYYKQCLTRRTHIASIHANDGTSSTLEISMKKVDDKSNDAFIHIAQHRSHHNTQPSEACYEIANSFMSKYGGKKYQLLEVDTNHVNALVQAKTGTKPVQLQPEIVDKFLRMCDQFMPKHLVGHNIDWWKARVEEERSQKLKFYDYDFGYSTGSSDYTPIDYMEYYCDVSSCEETIIKDISDMEFEVI